MTFEELLRILKRWGWLALIPTALGILAAGTARPSVPVYQASIRFAVGIRSGSYRDYDYEGYYRWLSSEYLAAAVSAWIRSRDFAERVAAELQAGGLNLPAPMIQGALASDYQRSLLVLYITASDPETAEAIARAAAEVVRREVGQVWPQAGEGLAALTPLDVPVASPVAPPLRSRLEGPFRAILGLLVGVTLTFIAYFMDPRIWDRKDVERLGFRVLGEIPRGK
ncbi:YveK family protein [Thermoflexus sp.]|uniref:YveK family protein n=1 Tax=Thermoflexus sp. TaxID=1969742 RepID=UPI0035E46685